MNDATWIALAISISTSVLTIVGAVITIKLKGKVSLDGKRYDDDANFRREYISELNRELERRANIIIARENEISKLNDLLGAAKDKILELSVNHAELQTKYTEMGKDLAEALKQIGQKTVDLGTKVEENIPIQQ